MTEPIPVQIREIIDVVYRIVRVAGLDHGDAELLARWVARCEIDGGSRLDDVLHDAASMVPLAREAERQGLSHPAVSPGYAAAARDGLPIAAERFTRLSQASKAFLVAEQTLDDAEDA